MTTAEKSATTAADLSVEGLKKASKLSLAGGGILLLLACALVYNNNVNTAGSGGDNRWHVPYWFITIILVAAVLMALVPVMDAHIRADVLQSLAESGKLTAKETAELAAKLTKDELVKMGAVVADGTTVEGSAAANVHALTGMHGPVGSQRFLIIPLSST